MAFDKPLTRPLRRRAAGMPDPQQAEAHRELEDKLLEMERRLEALERYVETL